MTDSTSIQLNKLAELVMEISILIDNGKPFGNTEKQTLFLSYFDIDVEHIHAIHLLISKDYIGSLLALVRTFYETFFRALWVNAFATQKQLEQIRNDDFKFMKDEGSMGSKIEKLDEYYTGNHFFKNLKVGAWDIMSDYTHSGTNQLSRRWTDSELIPNYKEGEILEIIIEVTKTYLLFSIVLFQIHGYTEEENKIWKLFIKYKEDSEPILEEIYE